MKKSHFSCHNLVNWYSTHFLQCWLMDSSHLWWGRVHKKKLVDCVCLKYQYNNFVTTENHTFFSVGISCLKKPTKHHLKFARGFLGHPVYKKKLPVIIYTGALRPNFMVTIHYFNIWTNRNEQSSCINDVKTAWS